MSEQSRPHVGILGGGITGLTAAFYLLRAGFKVTVVESRPELGGLATYFDFGPFHWDKYYHCILTSDKPLQSLIADLNLSDELRWQETKVGFFSDGVLYSVSSSAEFLKFPVLSLWEKFRFGLGILYACRIRDGRQLESIPVGEWLTRIFGRANYQKMWAPLLRCKLGACREEASAAFIWSTIVRLYSTRDRSAGQKERLGYVRGGYRTVFLRLIEEIERLGGTIRTGVPVSRIESREDHGIDFVAQGERLSFDQAIATVPSHTLSKLTPELPDSYKQKLNSVKYLGIVCAVVLLKRALTPFYVTNLVSEHLPFTGVIEMTNLISLDETSGRHLVYLPKYIAPGDPLFEASDAEVWNLFRTHLSEVVPGLDDSSIERHFIFRERLVQPLPTLNYSEIVPPMASGIPNLVVANTTQIVNSTLNNNEMVKIARRAVELISQDTGVQRERLSSVTN